VIERAFVAVPHGQMHLAVCGPATDPVPIVLLHQTPRSWREYRDVLPLLGVRRRAIAVDTAGFGDSDPLPEVASIEAWAGAVLTLLDAIGIARVHLVGHHTGGVIAVELAARAPERVAALVLSSTPYCDPAFRRLRAEQPPIDAVAPSADGSHLAALWRKRQPFYPPGRPDLLQAFVADALKVRGDVEGGHRAVAAYRMEDRIDRVTQPVLLLQAGADPFAAAHFDHWRRRLPGARVARIDAGGVALPDQLPERFARAVLDFLDDLPR
jgi:pimeloyl-ACP methyl ester carboxylesterase